MKWWSAVEWFFGDDVLPRIGCPLDRLLPIAPTADSGDAIVSDTLICRTENGSVTQGYFDFEGLRTSEAHSRADARRG